MRFLISDLKQFMCQQSPRQDSFENYVTTPEWIGSLSFFGSFSGGYTVQLFFLAKNLDGIHDAWASQTFMLNTC